MRGFRSFYVFGVMIVLAASLAAGAVAQAGEESAAASQQSILLPAPRTLAGGYLAGRFAQRQQDWDVAQGYMSAVLSYDASNGEMTQRTFLLALGSGNYAQARGLAQRLLGGKGSELARIFLTCDAMGRGDFAGALALLDKLPPDGFGQYTKPMLTAWALMGAGKKAEALKLLSASAAPDDPAYHMHAGMMEELSGDMNAAADHYKIAMANGLNLHAAVMIANFFERDGQPGIAQQVYRGLDKAYPFNPFLAAASAADPQRKIAPGITRAADGAAIALFDLAALLYEKRAYDSAQVYGSLVRLLSPGSPFAHLMMGDIAALRGRGAEALAHYDAISPEDSVYWISRVRVSDVYEMSGRADKSEAMLEEMTKSPTTRLPALVALGDLRRRMGRFEEAVAAYSAALEGGAARKAEYWPVVYARGMAEERVGRWSRAEKDLLQALSFQPDNPMILNYIAYSWANQGVNLQRALEYARHAAALRPDDGYILDSYGWALFRLSQYQESVPWLERAVERMPGDSVLLDHLGDAYWQVGRQDEARYKWKHALDMSEDPAFKAQAQAKIERGPGPQPSQLSRNLETVE